MKLVVCFPGIGYHCDKPLLYYGRRVAESVGYKEYKNVEYVNRIGNVKGDPVKMQAAFEDLYGQTEEILKDIDFSGYDSILFLSKSVGTIIATTYAEGIRYHAGMFCIHRLRRHLTTAMRIYPAGHWHLQEQQTHGWRVQKRSQTAAERQGYRFISLRKPIIP